jgi:murein DD-endopeptidase MepM/ murein hydrolase activator NlpD
MAAADGGLWTGYGLYRGLPDPNDPYGLAVAILHDFGYDGKPLAVYAHLGSSRVWRATSRPADDRHRRGYRPRHRPHLHFEVRIGENYCSRPQPRVVGCPPEGWGVLAGRALNTSGLPLYQYPVHVKSVETGQEWTVFSREDTVNSDSPYGENFVLGDLPAGPYEVSVEFVGRRHTSWLFVLPGQTNFVVFKGREGFKIEPTPTPAARAVR